jgi:hypothetical protein
MKELGKYMMIGGLVLLGIGMVIYLGGDKLKWIGRLPGDIRIEKPGFRLYAPFASMIILSIVLSLLIWLIQRFIK